MICTAISGWPRCNPNDVVVSGFYKDRRMDRGSPRYNGGVRRETFISGVGVNRLCDTDFSVMPTQTTVHSVKFTSL